MHGWLDARLLWDARGRWNTRVKSLHHQSYPPRPLRLSVSPQINGNWAGLIYEAYQSKSLYKVKAPYSDWMTQAVEGKVPPAEASEAELALLKKVRKVEEREVRGRERGKRENGGREREDREARWVEEGKHPWGGPSR